MMPGKFKFAIDRGGTFTDIFALCPDGKIKVMKLLSEDPANYSDAPMEGIRRIIAEESGGIMSPNVSIDISNIEWIRMGTTVATNALLERKGERMALAVTQGFRDVLFIGNQSRQDIFSLDIKCPNVLYEEIIEVTERVILQQDQCQIKKSCSIKTGVSGESVNIWTPLNIEKLKVDLQNVLNNGIRSLAVVLVHSHLFSDHEKLVGKIAKDMGFEHVSLSSEVMPMIRLVPRGHTACVDAYLTPCIKRYVQNFASGFEKNLEGVNTLFMQSDGGLTSMSTFCGSRAILSGPAGGVVGYSMTTHKKYSDLPVIGFDMGGTSTDVSRFDGQYEHTYDTTVSGVTIQAPQLDIRTVAAGGGSMLFFHSGLLVVGPESAGAHPGPVCYRKAGSLTITDANLCLGRIQPEYFPKIFGKSKNLPLDKDATLKEFKQLARKVNDFMAIQSKNERNLSVEELALGFITVANETMCRPIRSLTQGKGFDPSQHVLACFGGAGGQHACSLAKIMGISKVFIHKYAGILSALGMALANVVQEVQESCAATYDPDSFEYLNSRIAYLSDICIKKLMVQGFSRTQISFETYLNLRYDKTDCALMCSAYGNQQFPANCHDVDFINIFIDRHTREFGFCMMDRKVIVDDIRIRAIGQHSVHFSTNAADALQPPQVQETTKCYFNGGYQDTNIYLLNQLFFGHKVSGPSIIIDDNCTILVEPDCLASVTKDGSILIDISNNDIKKIGIEFDMIQLSVFSHRFMGIAEQMGKVLQRTSVSTNIKERLDFSCALFGPDGDLVSNAPHIPVHLGAMQAAVQFQINALGNQLKEGDVLLSNHPFAGGSHLPDLTVITPVFYSGQKKPVFFVASRGHHADIGGLTPGSMPPHSTSLFHEGASFISFKLVEDGIFQEKAVTDALQAPALLPGCSGTRNLRDNLSDLKAQVAANQKGIHLTNELITAYGLDVIQAYMFYIQKNAEVAVKDILKKMAEENLAKNKDIFNAYDYMDDGTKIQLEVMIDVTEGSAIFNFTGTGSEVYGNCNCPRAVVLSAIIYCLRCMVGRDIPLNQGCLSPIKIIIPENSILSPSPSAAVVGGNVLTSQRIVDVIFKAFETCAASQGCMNNITFGDENIGYYETVAGGSGAGPFWHGRSGVHTHMTNTRITDIEIFEKRYPAIIMKFQLNPRTGGQGVFNGGDGVVREILFRKNLTLSILTERRVFSPYGIKGGEDGKRGLNLLIFENGRVVSLGSKNSVEVSAGDIFHLETPGGGAYGKIL